MTPIDLNDPIEVLLAAFEAFERANIEAATYGGLALAVYGEPRETKDADFAMSGINAPQCEYALRAAGFEVVPAFHEMLYGGQRVSRLTLVGGTAGSLNTVDLVEARSLRYAREVLARSITGSLRGQSIRVVSPEDFVILKILATRPRDLEDAFVVTRSLADRLDIQMMERELTALAVEISDHDIVGRWQAVQSRVDSP